MYMGRPKGSINEKTKRIIKIQDAILTFVGRNIDSLIDRLNKDGEIVYLINQAIGKPKEQMDFTTAGEKLQNYVFTDEQLAAIASCRSRVGTSEETPAGVLDSDESEISTELASSTDNAETRTSGEGGDQTTDDLHATEIR